LQSADKLGAGGWSSDWKLIYFNIGVNRSRRRRFGRRNLQGERGSEATGSM